MIAVTIDGANTATHTRSSTITKPSSQAHLPKAVSTGDKRTSRHSVVTERTDRAIREHTDPSRAAAAQNFIQQMGLVMQADGGPRIAGRIFGLLLVEGRAMSLSEIATSLEVSRASASTNARLLARGGLLRLISRPGDRQDFYELVENPFQHMLASMGARLRRMASQIAEAEPQFLPDDPAKARIRDLADQHLRSAQFIEEWAANLRHSQAKRKGSKR